MNPTDLIDQGLRLARGTLRQTVGLGRRAAGQAWQLGRRGVPGRPASATPKDLDDVTLARKVESEVFRDADAPKASVDINVVEGVVELRGQVKRPQEKASIEARVRAVPEVKGVENLLHLPKTPASTRADAPGRQRAGGQPKARRAGATAAKPRPVRPKVTTDDQTDRIVSEKEPAPAELAREGKGRQAAPLGSSDPDAGSSGPDAG